jgi:hypothetical protein
MNRRTYKGLYCLKYPLRLVMPSMDAFTEMFRVFKCTEGFPYVLKLMKVSVCSGVRKKTLRVKIHGRKVVVQSYVRRIPRVQCYRRKSTC